MITVYTTNWTLFLGAILVVLVLAFPYAGARADLLSNQEMQSRYLPA